MGKPEEAFLRLDLCKITGKINPNRKPYEAINWYEKETEEVYAYLL
ncbi:hypothetical protein ADIS_2614 [Lunatimonas lonarensis]|uniref:Uncharacterized protein n=1 Tax=Lunatimonas lonarensis TaxID=1232681 RepID=R7ZSC7_9BACT|nr:hypothetical protein ADIS_2614 [Lunatimonas lonarensis]